MGAVVDILKEIPKIKIYGSNLTIEILKEELQLNDMNYKKYSFCGKTFLYRQENAS